MATRTIVTSHPELPCDVCGRRLLRGERPDVFVAGGGRRLTVCELCTPRAAQEGWRREAAHAEDLGLSPARPRRARNLLGRLRQLRESAADRDGEASAPLAEVETVSSASASAQAMAEEFEPVQPLHGAIERAHSVAAPVAAPMLGEIALVESESGSLEEEPDGQGEPDERDESAEEGSWRDAWMFVGE